MMKGIWRLSVIAVLAALLFGLVLPARPAEASVKGRRNTALALSGAALYELVKGHGTAGLLLAGGSYYAWQQVRKAEHGHRARYRVHRVGYTYPRHHSRHVVVYHR